jgi:hypothetical protein
MREDAAAGGSDSINPFVVLSVVWAGILVGVRRVVATAVLLPSPHCVAFLEENQNIVGVRTGVCICPGEIAFRYCRAGEFKQIARLFGEEPNAQNQIPMLSCVGVVFSIALVVLWVRLKRDLADGVGGHEREENKDGDSEISLFTAREDS